jgi:hypothetical protein
MVYLTTAYPFYFALNTRGLGRAMVLEIESDELNEELFFPDEDFVVQGLALNKMNFEQIHDDVRANLEVYQQHWKLSIEKLGNCCYKGNIHAAAIKRVCFFDPEARPLIAHAMLEPTISIINYHLFQATYRSLVAWMFGDIAEFPQDPGVELYLSTKSSNTAPGGIAVGEGIKKHCAKRKQESKDRTSIEVVRF